MQSALAIASMSRFMSFAGRSLTPALLSLMASSTSSSSIGTALSVAASSWIL